MLRINGQFNINTSVVHGDKSVSHRALILSSIANGKSVIRNLTLSRDVLATVNCLRKLGAKINLDGNTAIVEPIAEPRNNVELNCENSGTTARLLAGLVAGLGVKARFVGDNSLSKRPMDRVLVPLREMSAHFRTLDGGLFESLGGKLYGKKIAAVVNSAQVKSAVLLAGLFAEGKTVYVEKLPTRNHTELMLRDMGADISVDGSAVTVAKSKLRPLDFDVPCDVSSMAFLAGAALMLDKQVVCRNTLLNDRRIGFISVLKRSGADISFKNIRSVAGEKVGDVVVNKSRLKPLYATETDVCDGIDELPILAALAIVTEGKHVFESVSELRSKESDRIQAIIDTAKICNQQVSFDGENITIVSNGRIPKNPRFKSFNDHRIAMAQAVLCLAASGGTVDETPFDVSFPEFCQSLGLHEYKLGLIGSDIANSRSPLLMEYLASGANVSCSYDLVALPQDVTDEELFGVIRRYDGLNVTMPFKTRAARLLNADCIAVNTVGKNVQPQSTDGYGIVKALEDCKVDFANKPVWIVGAGGAAVTCVETLLKYGCKMQIINRTESRARELTAKYNLSTDIAEPYGVLSFIPECEFERGIKLPDSCKFVFVAAYKGKSGLKEQAEKRCITYVDGLRMLYHQGAKSLALWTNTPLQDDYESFKQLIDTCC